MNFQAGCSRTPERHFLLSFLSINALISSAISFLLIFLLAVSPAAATQAKTATTTGLTVTASGSATTSVPYGTKVTLTATVTPASGTIAAGQVNFCDGGVKYCTDIHIIGTAQITSAGTAAINLHPAPGSYSYEAVFVGTTGFATSTSSVSPLTVTGKFPTITQTTLAGQTDTFSLTATVHGSAKASAAPTGTISFVDASASNAQLGTATLGNASTALLGNVANLSVVSAKFETPGTVAVGDFNGDGIQDMAIGGWDTSANNGIGGDAISVLLGDGAGNFTPVQGSPFDIAGTWTGEYPLAIQDFNGDGIPDILAAPYGKITVLLGNGDGTFRTAPGSPFTENYSVSPVVAADFNGDGIPDFVLVEGYTKIAYLGNGDGSFATPIVSYTGEAGTIASAVVGDFNGDGIPDLVASVNYGPVYLFLSNGDGTFQPATAISSTTNAVASSSIAVGDFNGDGNLDLAVPVYGGISQVVILLGNGDGTFHQPTGSPISGPASLTRVTAGDFNGDGISDLLLQTNPNGTGGGAVSVLLGNGDGTFTAAMATIPNVPCCYNSALGDFNGDRLTDVVTSSEIYDTAQVLFAQDAMATATANGITAAGPASDQVVAQYPGDGNFTPSTSAPVELIDAPVFTPPGGSYSSAQQVSITSNTPNTTISYTTNGVTPKLGFNSYAGAINVISPETINAIAFSQDGSASAMTSASYVIPAPVPSISSLSPASRTAESASFTLTVNGANFTSASKIMWGTIALSTQYVNATELQAGIPTSLQVTEGTISVTVQTPAPGGGTSNANTFTINAQVPYLGSISPASIAAGSAAFTLTVSGNYFTGASTVMWGSTALTTTYVNTYELTAQVPAALVATEGTASVTVQSPAPGGGTSSVGSFQIGPAVPSIGSILPTSTAAGSAAFPLTVNGANFTNASTVMWGSTALTTTYVSDTQLTAQVPALLVAAAGTASVTVQTPAPGGGTSNASSFEIDAPVPSIGGIAPATATAGSVAFPLTVNGANFTSASTVMWGSTALTTQYVSATQLTAQVTASLLATEGTVSVTVQTPAPGGGTSNANTFTINALVPSIGSIAPASTAVGSAAFPLTVTGTNFTSASTVLWGTTSLTTQFVSATALTAQVPASLVATEGTVSVTVQTPAPGGGTSNANTFTVNALVPSISSIAPASAAVGSAAFPLTVNGANFTSASTVLWGGAALTTTYVSAIQLTAQVPASMVATAGNASVTVQTPAPGGGTSNASSFSVYVPALVPSIGGISPATATAGSAAFPLTVTGANFTSASTVLWGATSLTTQYVSATVLTASVPASLVATAGTYSVTVQTPAPGGGTSNAYTFEIDTAGSTTPPTFSTVTVTVTAGTPASYPVTLPSTATSVSVTCLNLPAYATCSYTASTGTLTVNTTASTPAGTYVVTAVFSETLPGAASSIILLPLFLVPFAGKRKRRKAGILLLALAGLAIAVTAAGGCGGGGGSSSGYTQPTTHSVTSSGTVTLVVH